ncbi:acyltransferase [Nocardioides sp. BGMRC 2183]|nr:acyltransferase [Nocardioides sp. BGMRC 2183]
MRRLDIQGLRAIAVLTVVADHAGIGLLSGGFIGVDVFFVLSGFLITSLLVKEADREGRISLLGFYARRARRILPAATVVLLAILAFAAATLSYLRVERIATDVGWAAVFLANIRFADLGTDYFAEGLPPSPVQHYWSLAVEEQFYLVWPPLLMLVLWLAGRRTARRLGTRPVAAVAAVVAALGVASFAWSVHLLGDNQTAAYFSSLGRAWELAVGALLAVVASRFERMPTTLRWVLSGGGLAAIMVAAVGYDASTSFPGPAALLPVLGTAAVLAAGIGVDAVGPARVLTVRPLTWIGDLSYSWYLWHWPVLVLWEAQAVGPVGWLETTALVGLSLLLAIGSYHLIENPVRRNRWVAARQRRALALWPLALGMVVAGMFASQAVAEQRLAERLDANAEFLDLRDGDLGVRQELRASIVAADEADTVPFPLTDLDMVSELEQDLWNVSFGCNAQQPRSSVELCPIGDSEAERTAVVIGDSHMGQWLPALDELGAEHGYRVVPLIKFGCSPFAVDITWGGRDYHECTDFRAWATEQVAELEPEVVVVGSRGLQRNMTVPAEERAAAWTEGVTETVRTLEELTDEVVVIGDVPPLGVDPIECVTDASATMATCTTAAEERVLEANRLTEAAARELGVRYVDVADLVCVGGRCPAVAGGLMVYANDDHLSRTWVRHVTPKVAERLGWT